ncbi:concanavalin A-like lectin/glucanase domain-containing protein [Powellomyces hirtus]|nr:concanavalin A-like lectin/glucanase domain-containing protein [Powellomyces hirtus]
MHFQPIALCVLSALSLASAALPATPAGWTRKWADDFTGIGQPSASNWIYSLGTGYPGAAPNWGTGEIEANTNSPSNVFLDGSGNLVIKAIRSSSGSWTSARIETAINNFAPPAGGIMAVEGRLKLPQVAVPQGYWPAFWMLGTAFRGVYTNWPSCGEIDIMENVNGINTQYGTLHCDKAPGGECNESMGRGASIAGGSPTLHSDFHVLPSELHLLSISNFSAANRFLIRRSLPTPKDRVEVDLSVSPQAIRWYLDGALFHRVTQSELSPGVWNSLTSHGWYIILNLAIGGGWPGNPTASTTNGGELLVDYVSVYTKTASGGTPPNPNPPTQCGAGLIPCGPACYCSHSVTALSVFFLNLRLMHHVRLRQRATYSRQVVLEQEWQRFRPPRFGQNKTRSNWEGMVEKDSFR